MFIKKITKKRLWYQTKQLYIIFTWLFFSVVLISCSNQSTKKSPTDTVQNTASIESPQASLQTATIDILISEVTTPVNTISNTCWDNAKQINSYSDLINGNILFYDSSLNEVYVFDSKSEKAQLLNISSAFTKISPDGSLIANLDVTNNVIWIITEKQGFEISVPDNLYLGNILESNEIQLGIAKAMKENYEEGIGTTNQYYILSPETGQIELHTTFLPNYGKPSFNHTYERYSSDLRYIIYPAYYNGQITTILYDIEEEKIIWNGWDEGVPLGRFPLIPPPVWTPSNEEVTIITRGQKTNYENLANVNIDGTIEQLTQLEDIFDLQYELVMPVWSPDGRFLAFRIKFTEEVPPSENNLLLIFDTETHTLINPCISLGSMLEYPVWSPGSKQLVVTPRDELDDQGESILIDLPKQNSYHLFKSSGIIGWVNWEIP